MTMNILGISAFYHDSAACLVQDGRIVAAAQEERFTRNKADDSFPVNAIQYCIEGQGLTVSDIDYIAFYDKPLLKFDRLLKTYLTFAPRGQQSFVRAMSVWLGQKLWIKRQIRRELGFQGKILFPEHHESHAASAFFPSPFQEAAFLTIDGVGEWTSSSYGVGKDNQLAIWADTRFPHSLGLLYSVFTAYTGYRVNSGEYKVMGLAPYGEPVYKDRILDELIDLKEDGSFRLNMEYFDYCVGSVATNEKFHQLFEGEPTPQGATPTQREMDLARSIQEVIEEAVLRIGRHVRKETGQRYLCLAGGVALNCVANGKLLREGVFDDIWIQPAAGDAGGALGAALATWYQYLGNERQADGMQDSQQGSYLGPDFDNQAIASFMEQHSIPYQQLADDEIAPRTADLIADENVIGWFQGRMEFGPRALGARSIIGDPRSSKMQEIMNLKIKFRESFRPFAPSVLAERVSDYFAIDSPSPYMLLVSSVRPDRRIHEASYDELQGLEKLKVPRSDIPAITHVDYSARVQTVHKETNPRYYDLIAAFDQRHGCGVVINTSFNVRGEPVVCTPEDAYLCFMRTNMDYLIMGNFMLSKQEQPEHVESLDWQTEFVLD